MVIDKKISIEKTKQIIQDDIRNAFWDSQREGIEANFEKFSEGLLDSRDIIKYVDKPSSTKTTCVVFNSSFKSKKIAFNLVNNPTPKEIHNTYEEFSLAPLEFRIASVIETIDTTDYIDSYESGLATYSLSEIDVESDTTTFIENIQLAIPSLDDYMRVMLNFFDKMAKLVTIDYTKNLIEVNAAGASKTFQQNKSITDVRIIKTNSSMLTFTNEQNLTDIDYKFYIDETYDIIVNRSKLAELFK